ncbi:MAG: RsmB/NOP family class I SAM-dependent RNA methyltransferase [Gemmatimonadota bacterium]
MPDWAAFNDAAARSEPTVFRVRLGRVAEEVVLARLREQGFRTRRLDGMPAFHQVEEEPYPVSMTFEHWNGLIYVQQASTGVAAPALDPRPGERVLDLCSAPGGKTAHAAELMGDTGCLVASEISENRIRGLLGNMYRLCHTNVLAVAGDGRTFPGGAMFDRVLVDAPCTGEGTLRRRGGRPPRQSPSFLGYVTAAQHALLQRAVELTRPGGVILYVTCTFAPEENEAVVSRILSELPVELEPLDLPVPHAPGLTSFDGQRFDPRLEGAARIYPYHLDSGGLFLAKLRRKDGPAGPSSERSVESGEGWTPVPAAFPDEGPTASEPEEADALVSRAVEELVGRFGVDAGALDRFSWTVRGGRVWMHSVDSWPLESWPDGGWRPISIGLRAVEFDTRGRARPTNDVLRLLSGEVTERRVDLDEASCRSFLGRQPVQTPLDFRGPIAVRYQGDVIGRGALTGDGLKTEIPKARAHDLLRVMEKKDG